MPFGDVAGINGSMPVLEGSYRIEVLRLEDLEPGQYGERMRWVFACFEDDGEPVCWSDGERFEWYQTTGATLGPRSTAREWAEKFLSRELQAGESGEEVARQLVGRSALALIEQQANGYARISGLTPYRAPRKSAKAETPADPF